MITSPEFFLVSSFAVLLMNIGADSVSYEQFGQTHKIEGVDTIVVAMGSASAGQLREELKDHGKPVHVIGDAGNIGKIVNAIADGRISAMVVFFIGISFSVANTTDGLKGEHLNPGRRYYLKGG